MRLQVSSLESSVALVRHHAEGCPGVRLPGGEHKAVHLLVTETGDRYKEESAHSRLRYLHDTSEGYLTKGPCMAPPVLGSCLPVLSAAFVLCPVAVMGGPVGQRLKLQQGHQQTEL